MFIIGLIFIICCSATNVLANTNKSIQNSTVPQSGVDLQNTGQTDAIVTDFNKTKWINFHEKAMVSPIVVYNEGTIYFGNYNMTYYAVYGSNGSIKWQKTLGNGTTQGVESAMAIAQDGTVYATADNTWDNQSMGVLYSFDKDGNINWELQGPIGVFNSPKIDKNGTIYVGSNNATLYAVNPDGSIKWEFKVPWENIPNQFPLSMYGSVAIGEDGTIYSSASRYLITNTDFSRLYAINPDGTEKWNYSVGNNTSFFYDLQYLHLYNVSFHYVGNNTSFFYDPSVDKDGTIYVIVRTLELEEGITKSSTYTLHAINPDGTKKWSKVLTNQSRNAPSIANDGTIYYGTYDGVLHALNKDGTEKWNFTVEKDFTDGRYYRTDFYAKPIIDKNGVVYFGTHTGRLYAINPDGTEKWSYDSYWNYMSNAYREAIAGDVAIDNNGTVYYGTWYGVIYAINSPVANLLTVVTANNTMPNINEVVNISFLTTNDGPQSSFYTHINYTIPDNFEFIDMEIDESLVSSTKLVYSESTKTITWYYATLPSKKFRQLNVILKAIKPGNITIAPVLGLFTGANNDGSYVVNSKIESETINIIDPSTNDTNETENNQTDPSNNETSPIENQTNPINNETSIDNESFIDNNYYESIPLKNTGVPFLLILIISIVGLVVKKK